MNIYEKTENVIKAALGVQKKFMKEVQRINAMKYKKVGLCQIKLSKEEKQTMLKKEKNKCNKVCFALYENINAERKQAGEKELYNPFNE